MTVRIDCEDEEGCLRCTAFNAGEAARYLWEALELGVDTVEGKDSLDRGIYLAQRAARLSEGIHQH
jgi:hypothetical protein